ncbi:terminase large subunit [Marilutibacter spongiae]|uniref:Terminase large subunit n=1 Tax=Marilutibacter spongiae TaxID=2025720 RepID=A0A7W3TLA2_9GAMM|nr:terminase TerL endonuclease subunit [Lysobacter spongiae]MBB1060415.1 terminase large subunit [Lysobacter spongiae]
MAWDLSCRDWWSRLQAGRSLVPGLPLWTAEAERAVRVFNKLRLADVPGTPTMEEAGGEWFRDIVRAMFGSVDPATRERMIRELFALVPKKNSKTTDGALLMVTALLLNQRPRAGYVMTAPVQDVAQLAFDAAAGAIELDPVLDKKLHVRHHLKTIIHRETKAELEIMTFDPSVLTGQKISGGALIDELHVCAKMAKAPKALRQIRGGMLPFPEAFLAFITTQSDEAPVGIFADELQKARDIRDGKREGAMLPVLFEFPKELQESKDRKWESPALWPLVTPNLGKSITIQRLQSDYQEAKDTSEVELRIWASQHLNLQIGVALHAAAWAGAEYWEAQSELGITLEELLERCEVVDVGIDGGGLDDLLGLAVVGRDKETRDWLVWSRAWAHPSVMERRKAEAERFNDFASDGDLVLVQQIGEDVEQVADIVAQIEESGLLDKVGVDPAGLGAILDALEEAGVPKDKVVGVSQGWKLTGAIKTAERKLAEGTLWHAGQPLMAWCAGNAKVEPRGNAIVITKQAAGTAKIDPLMAMFNAVTLMSLNPAAAPSIDDFLRSPVIA